MRTSIALERRSRRATSKRLGMLGDPAAWPNVVDPYLGGSVLSRAIGCAPLAAIQSPLKQAAFPLAILMLVGWAVWTFAFDPAPGWVHMLLTAGVFLLIWAIVARDDRRRTGVPGTGVPGSAVPRSDVPRTDVPPRTRR